MNNDKLKKKVIAAVNRLINEKGYSAPVDVLMEIEVLSKKGYEDWRKGKVDYLERVCHTNLSKLSLIMKVLRNYAKENKLKNSKTVYMKWGKGAKQRLRFSKSGIRNIEEAYSTHYVKGNC
ncbi:hypothetical protein [Oceanirhabdus sp. W0125-5]|uniref:hypothetical protein n=1 Tax=Oceanirhabdus sp. W0125-5 TaxID=2999116 RepID=UPI0022F2ED15|nr:hypothetical protein [Oceanirhabdus sp. W0125-5]WBW95199.1 hypothetical protein OW730_16060 [Oceanirhabdus sp. W0125-5]